MRIKACVISGENEPDYIYKTSYKRMINEIDELTRSVGMDTLESVLAEMVNLLEFGACGFSPPVCGLLTKIGYFDQSAILPHAIIYMDSKLTKFRGG